MRRAAIMDEHDEDRDLASVMFDLMSGMFFVLILTLIAYTFNFTSNFDYRQGVAQEMSETIARRSFIVQEVSRELRRRGVAHDTRPREGVIAFSESAIGFPSGAARLDARGLEMTRRTAAALAAVLPCYTDLTEARATGLGCSRDQIGQLHGIEIEGHTDNVPVRENGRVIDNLDLSVLRAAAVVRALERHGPLARLRTDGADAVFSAAGFGDRRPVRAHATPVSDPRNRRVEMRFALRGPNFFAP